MTTVMTNGPQNGETRSAETTTAAGDRHRSICVQDSMSCWRGWQGLQGGARGGRAAAMRQQRQQQPWAWPMAHFRRLALMLKSCPQSPKRGTAGLDSGRAIGGRP